MTENCGKNAWKYWLKSAESFGRKVFKVKSSKVEKKSWNDFHAFSVEAIFYLCNKQDAIFYLCSKQDAIFYLCSEQDAIFYLGLGMEIFGISYWLNVGSPNDGSPKDHSPKDHSPKDHSPNVIFP
jgi:hypothetical protein